MEDKLDKYMRLVEEQLERENEEARKKRMEEGTASDVAVIWFLRKLKTQGDALKATSDLGEKLDILGGMLVTNASITTLNSENTNKSFLGRLKKLVSSFI